MRAFASLLLLTACGHVVDPIGDAGVDSGPPPSCPDFCSQAVLCGWEGEDCCDENCACILDHLYRPEVGAPLVRCISEEAYCGSEEDCLLTATAGIAATPAGNAYASACETRRETDCASLNCGVSLYFSDDALQAITPCLGPAFVSCGAVQACITQISVADCDLPEEC